MRRLSKKAKNLLLIYSVFSLSALILIGVGIFANVESLAAFGPMAIAFGMGIIFVLVLGFLKKI